MKIYKLSFISKKWGAIANEFVIKGKDESEAITNFTSRLNTENQLQLSLYEIKAEQLINTHE